MKPLALLSIVMLLVGCSSANLVSNWKNPDYPIFDANKVLIVGMAQDEDTRVDFETKLKKEFKKRNIEAMRSIDIFDVSFTDTAKTEEELDEVEQLLLSRDFDAILLTKVVGSQDFKKFRRRMSEIDELYGKFRDDYLGNQQIYYETDYYDKYTVYHAETSLYCICIDKERDLVWRGAIDVTDPVNLKKTVEDYIKLVVLAMEEQDIIFRKEIEEGDESVGLQR
nr:hypothetical protein [Allomuricauda sp.]